ncbi:MAG: hypothetical protein JXL97_02375 [Bacteroidales bacterium]|nr:hypothetical protein [Bacteroidales bacterium]
MEQKDYLMRQIDQLGVVLAAILGKLLGLKNQVQSIHAIELVTNELKEEANIDLEDILNEDIEKILSNNNLNMSNLETLTNILLETAETKKNEEQLTIYRKCLELFEYINKNDKNLSFERFQKIEELKKVIMT